VKAATGPGTASAPGSLVGLKLNDVFAWGKHLVMQFDGFALRFHFLMFGAFEAQIDGVWVTGDYRRQREPKLALSFENGVYRAFGCSLRPIPSRAARQGYDFGIDIMSAAWDERRVRKLLRATPSMEVGDALLDQQIFAGVGNIIKNEVLALVSLAPTRTVGSLSPARLRALVAETRVFAKQFYNWRRKFVLLKNLHTHRKRTCRYCGAPLRKAKTGKLQRWSYWCPVDQL
jgi:endonuclease VIII